MMGGVSSDCQMQLKEETLVKFLLEMSNRSTNAVLETDKGQFMFPRESC